MTSPATTPDTSTTGSVPGTSGLAAVRDLLEVRGDLARWPAARRDATGHGTFRTAPPGPVLPTMWWTTTPRGVRDALTDRAFGKASPVYEEMARVLGDGLLTSDGDRWVAQRRTLQPLFTPRRVDRYAADFAAAAVATADRWPAAGAVDVDEEMRRLSLTAVSTTLFGVDVTDRIVPILHDITELSEKVVLRGQAPWAPPAWLPTRVNRRLAAIQQRVVADVDAIVEERRRVLAAGEGDGDDLVALLLAAKDPETGAPLTQDEVREQAVIFLLAGHETTSTALTFALWHLARDTRWQDAVREEALEVLGPDVLAGTAPAAAADAWRLHVAGRVLDEAMRLHPPAFITSRVAGRPAVVDGFEVAPGDVVATSFWALHRDPAIWPDPERFDPDRFLPEAREERDPYAYLPFGGGPRSCIGERFARLEGVLALAVLVGRHRLGPRTDEPRVSLGITLTPAEPVLVDVAPTGVVGPAS
ncbi:MAG: cytochrome P450 [Actinomycetes bacterium]